MIEKLEQKVKKLIENFRKYQKTLVATAMLALPYGYFVPPLYNYFFKIDKAKQEIVEAKTKGLEVRHISGGKFFSSSIPNKVALYNPETKEEKIILEPFKVLDYYPLLYANLYFMALFSAYQSRKFGSSSLNLTDEEKNQRRKFITKSMSITGLLTAPLLYVTLQPLPMISSLGIALIASYDKSSRIFGYKILKQRYQKAIEENDVNSISYANGKILELSDEISALIRKNNLPEALRKMAERATYIRKFCAAEKFLIRKPTTLPNYFSHLIYSIIANVKKSTKNDLKLLVHTPIGSFNLTEHYINTIIKRNPEKEIEFRIIDFELCPDENERAEKGKQIYRRLTELGMISRIEEGKNNFVSVMNCNSLGKQYILKRNLESAIEKEVSQTNAVREGMLHEKQVLVPEILITYTNKDLEELQQDGLLMMGYIQGDQLSKYLSGLKYSEKYQILKKAVIGNAKTAKFGLNQQVENRYNKVLMDIIKNESLDEETKAIIGENISVCLKFSSEFPSLYDRDGHSDNALVVNSGKTQGIVLLDFEQRMKTDPTYMLAKLLEHKTSLSYDSDGIIIRNQLISDHFSSLELENKEISKLMEPNYYSSVVLKALSYSRFTSGRKDAEKIRKGYIKSALFSIDVLMTNYYNLYNSKEISQLQNLKNAMSRLL